MRSTFEARGYTAWDPTSPPWLLTTSHGTTLVIPTAFVSWTGDALDKKTPLLRSMESLSKQAVRILRLFGSKAQRVNTTCGPEQEYFLVDRQFYFNRPDLINAGRTLFGARPPKGQEMEDHYFGAIPERVLAFMMEVERELYRIGVPVKTRHNEVAPGQFELAPIFENANVATDHQMMTMEMLRRMAPKYGLACLMHEKPFAGVNGSGKHLNWSMSDDLGNNLLNPGDTPHDNIQFLVFCAAVLRAVNKFQGLLRFSIASAGQRSPSRRERSAAGDHLDLPRRHADRHLPADREGGQRQDDQERRHPRHRRQRAAEAAARCRRPQPHQPVRLHREQVRVPRGVVQPEHRVAERRPQPGGHRIARLLCDRAREEPEGGQEAPGGRQAAAREAGEGEQAIIFNGNGYSDDWQKEAAKRGLLNHRTSVDAYGEAMKPEVIEAFEKYGVLNEREVHARYDVAVEQYNKTINVEAQLMVLMANRYILPAAYRYQTQLAESVAAVKAAGATAKETRRALDDVCRLTDEAKVTRRSACRSCSSTRRTANAEKHAKYFRDKVDPGDGGAPRQPATASRASSRTTSGRSRPTGRCSSSSKDQRQTSNAKFQPRCNPLEFGRLLFGVWN